MFTKAEIQRRYWQSPKGKATKKRYAGSPKDKIAKMRYQQSKKGKITHNNSTRNHIFRYPERRIANQQVRKAVRNGILSPCFTQKCFYCENQAEHYHHYLGYEPDNHLNVIPICHICHNKLHAGYIL